MPGIRGPSDYSQEPPRHPCLKINSKEPFNAEPPRSALISSFVTPVDFFYKRNHGPIPIVDVIGRYYVSITGLIDNPKQLSMKDVRKLPKYNVTATLQLSGVGQNWQMFLNLLGYPSGQVLPRQVASMLNLSVLISEENGGPYKASIPLSQETNPEADVLLSYEMNGEPLNSDHGYLLRVVVLGVIGARSVKWLDSINIISAECQGFFMQKDCKMFPPSVNWENIDWSARRPQMDFPIQCAIYSLEDVNVVKHGKITIKGYPVSGGGGGIERVDASIDSGKTWVEASRYQKAGIYIADDARIDKWAWVLFEANANVATSAEIVAKAVDIAANVQPENVEAFGT